MNRPGIGGTMGRRLVDLFQIICTDLCWFLLADKKSFVFGTNGNLKSYASFISLYLLDEK